MTDALKLTFQDLAMLDWLLEKPGQRFFTTCSLGTGYCLYELSEKDNSGNRTAKSVYHRAESKPEFRKRFGGSIGIKSNKLFRNGFFYSLQRMHNNSGKYAAFVEGLTSNPLHWSETVHLPTKVADEWWQKIGREAFEAEYEKREKKRAAVSRRILIGCKATIFPAVPENCKKVLREIQNNLPNLTKRIIRPYAIATVTKETAARLYIEDIERLNPDVSFSYEGIPIQGSAPNQYIDRACVMVDNVTARGAMKLVEFDREYAETIANIAGEAMAQIIPIVSALNLRQEQKEAERLDLMRELIESIEEDPASEDEPSPRTP